MKASNHFKTRNTTYGKFTGQALFTSSLQGGPTIYDEISRDCPIDYIGVLDEVSGKKARLRPKA